MINALCESQFMGTLVQEPEWTESRGRQTIRLRLRGRNMSGGTVYKDIYAYRELAVALRTLLCVGDTVVAYCYTHSEMWTNRSGSLRIRNIEVAYVVHYLRTRKRVSLDGYEKASILDKFDPGDVLGSYEKKAKAGKPGSPKRRTGKEK